MLDRCATAGLLALFALSLAACDGGKKDGSDEAKSGDGAKAEAKDAKADADADAKGDAKPAPAKAADEPNFTFQATTSHGMSWDQSMPKAKARDARPDYVQVKATDFAFRIMANKIADEGAATSTDINFNNSFLHFKTEVGGKKMMIGCKPDQEAPKGKFERTKLDDTTVEGKFELELTQCSNWESGEAVEYDGVPFTVTGSFSVPLSK